MLRRRKYPKGGVLVPILIVAGVLFLILVAIGIFVIFWFVKTQFFGLGATGNGYLRITLSPEKTVWLQFEGNQMRTATSAEALEAVEWESFVYDAEEEENFSRTLNLPLEGEKPNDWDKVEIRFRPCGDHYHTRWHLGRTDIAGSEWTYKIQDRIVPSESLRLCPKVEVPNLDDPLLEVTLQPHYEDDVSSSLGVAVVLRSGDEEHECEEILKDGAVVSVQAQVLDDEGSLVESIEQPLSELGFT